MSRHIKLLYILSEIVKIRAKRRKKWLQVCGEPTPHFLPLWESPNNFMQLNQCNAHNTMHDDDSVELVSDPIQPYFDDEGDVEVRFRAALVDYFVALCRQASRR